MATAPAVANPYLNATTGTAADAGGGEAAQRASWHFLPRHCTDAELRAEDPQLQRLTDANRLEEATLDIGGGGGGPHARPEYTTSIVWKYHNMVLGGKVRAAVRMVTNRGTGGAYQPFDLDSKSWRPIIEIVIDHGIGGKHIPTKWRVLLRPDAGVSDDGLVCHHPTSQPHSM